MILPKLRISIYVVKPTVILLLYDFFVCFLQMHFRRNFPFWFNNSKQISLQLTMPLTIMNMMKNLMHLRKNLVKQFFLFNNNKFNDFTKGDLNSDITFI